MTSPARWAYLGACRDHDPELWHPTAERRGQVAKKICRTCPVIDTCLDYALVTPGTFGIWGATNDEDRKVIRRDRGITRKFANDTSGSSK